MLARNLREFELPSIKTVSRFNFLMVSFALAAFLE